MKRLMSCAVLVLVCTMQPAAVPQAGQGSDPNENRDLLVARLKTKLTTSDAGEHDCFGRSLAISGDTLIAGAKGDDDRGSNSGAAYVFQRVDGDWIQQTKLKASDAHINDFFGFSVGISGDAAIVGAWRDEDKGAAYVFRRDGGNWIQEAKLVAADGNRFDHFGYAVGISQDTIVVGAREDDDRGESAGSAYVFRRKGSAWTQHAKLTSPEPAQGDQFGWSVAIDGDTVLVGSIGSDRAAHDAGAAYVFRLTADAAKPEARLVAQAARAADTFGYAVGLSGNRAVVGAYKDDTAAIDAGAAYVFERRGTTWEQVQQLVPGGARPDEKFGWSVGVSGSTVVVGAWYADRDAEPEYPLGSAYLFKRGDSEWKQVKKLVANNRNRFDLFGWSVAVSGDIVVVGARLDDQAADEAGAVYVYEN